MITIHNDEKRCEKLFGKDRDLHYWDKYDTIYMSDDKCALFFAKTGIELDQDFWELHIAFDKSYRGKQAKNIIKTGIQWMLDNKTSRIICGIPKDSLNVRILANQVGFTKLGTENNNECYEIRR